MCRAVCSVPEEDLGTNACQRKGFYNLLCVCVCAIVLVGSLTPISAWLTASYGKRRLWILVRGLLSATIAFKDANVHPFSHTAEM